MTVHLDAIQNRNMLREGSTQLQPGGLLVRGNQCLHNADHLPKTFDIHIVLQYVVALELCNASHEFMHFVGIDLASCELHGFKDTCYFLEKHGPHV